MKTTDTIAKLFFRPRTHAAVQAVGLCLLAGLVAVSAVVTKEAVSRSRLSPLASMDGSANMVAASKTDEINETFFNEQADIRDPLVEAVVVEEAPIAAATDAASKLANAEIRYFNGRPMRPAKTITMVVTAYSPDARSCGDSADGITSSIHSVHTNAMKLVAADSKVLPLGSMITVPGYDNSQIVPVLDRGGAIKGKRLDVLYPTHEAARKWGVQKLEVVVWEYADGKPADDFRAIRDSKN